MIFGIIKDGVRSAFVRIVRYIVFAILILLAVYIIGLFTNNKASALSKKPNFVWDPDFSPHSAQHNFTHGNSSDWWSDHWFTTNWTNTSDFDLIGFHFNSYIVNRYNNQTINHDFVENLNLPITSTGILWESDGTGVLCYSSSEAEGFILCPIRKNISYTHFTVVTIAVNTPATDIEYQVYYELERARGFFNFDSTDIIDYFDSNGGMAQIINQQTITNQYIQDNTTTGSQTQATNSLNTLSGQFNDVLNGWGGQWSDLTHVVLEPINVILYAFDGSTTCQPITLNVPFMQNKQIVLPCMGSIYSTYFSTFITLFVMIMSGLYGYRTIMYIIRTIKEVIDADNDKIEVIDL